MQANLTRRSFLKGAALVMSAPALMSLAACGQKTVSWDGQTFKHGFDLDYRPYSYVDDNGQNVGFDVELAQAVCAYYGWEYVPVPFGRASPSTAARTTTSGANPTPTTPR